jgi:imidazolonepropionase-like amidohydrolase
VREAWLPENNRYRRRFTSTDGVGLGQAYEYQKLLVAAWSAAGVPIVLGTDASPQMPFVVPGFSALDELGELRAAGLSNADVLRAATANGARLLGREREIGQVAPGFRADLILLDANPLDDVGNVRRRQGVVLRGRWLTDKWLQEQLRVLGS